LAGRTRHRQPRLANVAGDVSALFVNDKIIMGKRVLSVVSLILLTLGAMAQQRSDHFLEEVFGLNSFKLNSTLRDIQNDKEISENLSFVSKMDNRATYFLIDEQINLPGLKSQGRLGPDTLELAFENNKLHDVVLFVPASIKDIILKKTFDQFNEKYGRAAIVDQKREDLKSYVWTLGANELSLNPYAEGLAIGYKSKTLNRNTGWIYTDRRGKGNGTIQLNLPCFEKLLNQKLTIRSFEKFLPRWKTTGVLNHVFYELNFKTLAADRPVYLVRYSLGNYDLTTETVDTTSKIINKFTLDKLKDTNVWPQFEKTLVNLHYIKRPQLRYSENIIYSNNKFLVFLDKKDSRISIMNDFKIQLP
jgi:hypothetical protein